MSYENLGGTPSRIRQVMESNWKIHPRIHSYTEPLLCAKQNYKPRRDTVRNQTTDTALVKLLTKRQ